MTARHLTRRGFLASVPAAAAVCGGGLRGGGGAGHPGARAAQVPHPPHRAAPTPASGGPARELVHATSGRPRGRADLPRRGRPRPGPEHPHGAGRPGRRRHGAGRRHVAGAEPRCRQARHRPRPRAGQPHLEPPDAHGHDARPRCGRRSSAAATGSPPSPAGPGAFFRPSAAQHATPEVLRLAGAAGYATVLSYDVDSRDFTDPGAAAIRGAVAAATRGLGREHAPRPPRHARRPSRAPRRPRRPWTHPGHRERPVPLIRTRRAPVPQPARPMLVCAVLGAVLAVLAALRRPRALAPVAPRPRHPTPAPGRPDVQRDPGDAAGPRRAQRLRRRGPGHALRGGEGGPADGLRAAHEDRRGLDDRPGHVRGRRALPAGRRAAARRAVVGHAHALREQRHRQPAHAVRPAHRPARHADPGDRPVQPVLHAGRPFGDLGGRGPPRAGVLRPAHVGRPADARHPGLHGHRPLRRHPRRAHGRVHLRVRRPRRRDRPGGSAASSA